MSLSTFLLAKKHFAADSPIRGQLDDFDCRADRGRPAKHWEAEVSEWLVADPSTCEGAKYRIQKKHCQVWLFFNEDTELVGYASLGKSKWPNPSQALDVPGLEKVPISLIPSLGIRTRFHGGRSEGGVKYSTQILNHLAYEARQKTTERQPFLGLYVHPENDRAISCYRNFGFVDYPHPDPHPVAGVTYLTMILYLRTRDGMSAAW